MDRASGAAASAALSRAERFDDEKRRIVDTCFNKKDTDGSLVETYITHIRITEFSSHPSSPPPPQARTPDSEKPRIIIIAVRKSGRVRMHKSKENTNGTFSIGKTWNLDDLSHIESYTGQHVTQEDRERASDAGFTVTLGKPYFWLAPSDKEKKFFVASLIKIYGKYTGGKAPELSGFDARELEQIVGAGRRPGTATPTSIASAVAPAPVSSPARSVLQNQVTSVPSAAAPPRPVISEPSPFHETTLSTGSTGTTADKPRSFKSVASRVMPNGTSSPARASPAGSIDSTTSRDRLPLRQVRQNNKSQESVATSFTTARSEDASSLPPRSRNGMTGPGAFGRFGETREPSEPPSEPLPPTPKQQAQQTPPLQADGKPPPERRRPPMDPGRPSDRDLVPQPLSAPKKDPVIPPPRSAERMSPRKGSYGQQPLPMALVDSPLEMEKPAYSPAMAPLASSKSEPTKPEATKEPKIPIPIMSNPTSAASSPGPAPAAGAPVPPLVPDDEEMRPGLGPMIKSKKSQGELAGALWKAASAAAAFKPRAGGAGERLRQLQAKKAEGPDGITGVVPAPKRPLSREARPATPDSTSSLPLAKSPQPAKSPQRNSNVPEVRITVPGHSRSSSAQGPSKEEKKAEEPPKIPARRSIMAANDARYLNSLGLNATLLDERSEEFSKWLDFFGWIPGEQMRVKTFDDVKTDLDRELNKAQAGGWLSRFEEEDERVGAIKTGIDVAIDECEELDNLLTLYSVELSTLSDDIAYIEAQGQGLQVQTANQKLLKTELESLLETCAITPRDLQALRHAPFDETRGLEDIETALVTLFRAMVKIDPTLGGGDANKLADAALDSDQAAGLSTDFGQMRIVQEKKEMYSQESNIFVRRLLGFMAGQFEDAYAATRRALEGPLARKVDPGNHDVGRDMLWKFSPLMLYARDVDLENWNRLIQVYQDKSHPIYKTEFQNISTIWKKNAKKLTGDEAELLFTSQVEKQQEGVATTARKLTVKRSQTLARALRSPLAEGGSRTRPEKSGSESQSLPYEVFAGVLNDLLPLVEMEQNFIVDFFHASTLDQADFPDAVSLAGPRDRGGADLKRHRLMEPDRDLARRVTRSMEVIYSFLEQDLQRLMEWVIGQDALQGIGVLAIIERMTTEISQSNQDFLNGVLQKLYGGLEGRFRRFVDEQIRAIEETKVKINKRKGVISFIRVFPTFSTAIENMAAGLDPNLSVRRVIDREYDRILRSMFDSLMVIARENPAVGVSSGGADPEDKEALNFHILLIENMNHFLEETDTHGGNLEVLEEWKQQADREYHEHMGLYVNAVVRRPLGKLLDHLENIEAQIQSGKPPGTIGGQPSNSKTVFNKVLSGYDSKEVRKGIEALKKRVEKHFGDADDPALSRGLVAKVLRECEGFYGGVEGRIGRVTTDVYGGDVLFEWPRQDVKAAFR